MPAEWFEDTDPGALEIYTRRQHIVSGLPGLENLEFPVSSPEDTVLAKLVWFRQGGEVSDRQWHDILGVLSVQAPRLDRVYLNTWAERLNVADLLQIALRQSFA